jgi:hypothetical protein
MPDMLSTVTAPRKGVSPGRWRSARPRDDQAQADRTRKREIQRSRRAAVGRCSASRGCLCDDPASVGCGVQTSSEAAGEFAIDLVEQRFMSALSSTTSQQCSATRSCDPKSGRGYLSR